ncbi:TetR/AcrR family transcriptional regulator [Sphingopyxis panaciterrae]
MGYSHMDSIISGRKPQTTPRKIASQARARATVDALVEATARILVRDGFDRASTNRIAEAAGVSIGSLYQYFPSKEALVVAVIERHNHDLMTIVTAAFAKANGKPLAAAIRLLVVAAIDAHRVDPELHRVLAEQTPRSGALANIELFQRDAHSIFRSYLEENRSGIRVRDLDLAAFICVTSIEALTHTAVIHRPDILVDERVEQLVEETSGLIAGYLGGADRGPSMTV